MGTWNIESLYGNDLAADIKPEVKATLSMLPIDEGIERILSFYKKEIDEDEKYILWLVIGDVLWSHGLLNDNIKSKVLEAVYYAEYHIDDIHYSPGFISKYKQKIISVQSAKRKISKPQTHHSKWNEGDVLAYQLLNHDMIPEVFNSLYDKYMLIRVASLSRWAVSNIMESELYDEYAMVMLYNWVGELSEISKIKFDDLEFLPIRIQNRANVEDTIYMKGYLYNKPSGDVKWNIQSVDNVGKFNGNMEILNYSGVVDALEIVLIYLEKNGYTVKGNSFIKLENRNL